MKIALLAWIIAYLPSGHVTITADDGKYLRQKTDETEESRSTRVALPSAALIDEWEEFAVEADDNMP